jgi:heme exporter protein D
MDFLAMGGYAAYVWPAYGLAALVLGGLTWQSLRAYRTRARALEAMVERRGARRRGSP